MTQTETPESVATVAPAWDFIGYDGPDWLRIVGGRALYEAAIYYDDTRGSCVKLSRLEANSDGIRQVNRYVHPDTPVEVVKS
jgi:hypothetical protein